MEVHIVALTEVEGALFVAEQHLEMEVFSQIGALLYVPLNDGRSPARLTYRVRSVVHVLGGGDGVIASTEADVGVEVIDRLRAAGWKVEIGAAPEQFFADGS